MYIFTAILQQMKEWLWSKTKKICGCSIRHYVLLVIYEKLECTD